MFMFTTNVFGWVTAEVDMGKDPRDHFRNLSGFGVGPFPSVVQWERVDHV